jgi:hypothetical protein
MAIGGVARLLRHDGRGNADDCSQCETTRIQV